MNFNYKMVPIGLIMFLFGNLFSHGNIRFIMVDVMNDSLIIKNYSTDGDDIDISELSITLVNGERTLLSELTVTPGNLSLNDLEEAIITGFTLPDDKGGLSLYKAGTTDANATDPDKLFDFVQWGEGGQGREEVADEKGIWTPGDFLESPTVFTYNGDGSDNGIDFWEAEEVSTRHIHANSHSVYQVLENESTIKIQPAVNYFINSFEIFILTVTGKQQYHFTPSDNFILNKNLLNPGVSFIQINDQNGVFTKKFVLTQ